MKDTVLVNKMQRAKGRVSFHVKGEKITRLFQSGSSKLLLPKTYTPMREAVILNTSGGIAGGDRVDIEIEAQNCPLTVTTQAAERLYRSNTTAAKINIELIASNNAVLHWLPQETIIFNKSKVDRNLNLRMFDDSSCLIAETVILGRQAMGENVCFCRFTDNWRIYCDEKLIHAESFRLDGNVEKIIASVVGSGGNSCLSTIFYFNKDAEEKQSRLKKLSEGLDSTCATSFWGGKLLVRLLSKESLTGLSVFQNVVKELIGRPMPRVWPK